MSTFKLSFLFGLLWMAGWGSGFPIMVSAADAEPVVSVRLQARYQNGLIDISWPYPSPGLELQECISLGPTADWRSVPIGPEVEGETQRISLDSQGPARFFRLVKRLHHVLIAGQSLGIGANSGPVLSTNQPFQNKMFIGQKLHWSAGDLGFEDLSAFKPLREYNLTYVNAGETIASGFANWISDRVGPGVHDLLVSNCARGATPYEGLKRIPASTPEEEPTGTIPYMRGLQQVIAGRELAEPSFYKTEAILVLHGESDSVNALYDLDIREWQRDFEGDIQRLTGQTNIIPMFHSQISSWSNLGNASKSLSPTRVLMESIRSPERTILVGPKYIFPYANDGLHLTSEGFRWLGEYYAKAYRQHVMEGRPWKPVRPILESIFRTNDTIDITFTGVVGQLVFDTNLVSDPGGMEIYDPTGGPSGQPAVITVGPYGFEYTDKIGTGTPWRCDVTIRSVEMTGTDSIRITLSSPPRNDNFRIRYAYTALNTVQGGQSGPEFGARGCLRDNDLTESRYGHTLYNWCVHFDLDYLGRN